MSEYVDINSVETTSEDLGKVVSPEYNDRPLTTPGRYVSEPGTRTITAKKKVEDGKTSFTFQIDLKGIVDRTSGRRFFRPDRTWVSTKLFRKRDFSTGSKENPSYFPGETSTAADYLVSCGFSRQEVRNLSGQALISAMAASVNRPVGVKTGLKPRGRKENNYETPKLYTRAFEDPTSNGEKKYLRSIEHEGQTWEAQETVEGFFKVTG